MDPLPVETLRASGARFLLHEHPGLTDAAEVCATLGVPLSRTVKTLAFVPPRRPSRPGRPPRRLRQRPPRHHDRDRHGRSDGSAADGHDHPHRRPVR
ncbi:hypothetical protein [Streptomyces sp. YU58]|uniref:hypothetical protein n=1 Tax=Streptomyces sp. SX92 TaxID=3158972 RepID=UPI0027B938FC|nr:hypothetical protein [Streptomyces coralus]WLW53078.1 hypothetical protein QU709_17555 [Streptomyces coralus]